MRKRSFGKFIKAACKHLYRRATCHHEYALKGISLGREDVHQAYWLSCVHCEHEIYIPLATGSTLRARFHTEKELDSDENTLRAGEQD